MYNFKLFALVAGLCLSGCASGYEQQPYAGTRDRIDPVLCQAPQYLGDYQRGLCASQGVMVAQGASQVQPTYSGTGATYNPVYGSSEGQAITAQATPSYPPSYQSSTVLGGYRGSSGGCQSGNYYGATSCITGLPKTTHVRSYYRKDGTFVSSHYRSRR